MYTTNTVVRTQIYLTEEQQRRIRQQASDAGISQAEVIRRILDKALRISDGLEERLAAIDATAGVLADAPDWPEWLEAVRGRGMDERLAELGL